MDLLTHRALQWAEAKPDQIVYRFLDRQGVEVESLSYKALLRRSLDLADHLRSLVPPGSRVLLLFPSGLDFIVAFVGCLLARVIAVPAYPPGSRRTLPRVRHIASDASASVALTTSAHLEKLEVMARRVPELAHLHWLAIDPSRAIDGSLAEHAAALGSPAADDVAFLQYTSGSTGSPKGVMVSHGNLANNEAQIEAAFEMDEESVVVGWLPMYHDMGLIGNVLQPLWIGASCVLMSPTDFLRKPICWLEAIDRYRGTVSGAPNFAYELCVDRIEASARRSLDLSCWKVAFNGAEPVRHETLESFARAFEVSGFPAESLYPCYGLAEATLFVTGGHAGSGSLSRWVDSAQLADHRAELAMAGDEGQWLVSSGHCRRDHRVIIAPIASDDDGPESTASLPPGQVGEVVVVGPSVASGYWRRPELSARTFRPVASATGQRGLYTGDLGFLTAAGELFITGRRKDLIILRGRNHYPQDLERTVEACHDALRPGCGAAFSVDVGGEERLVVVQELKRRSAKVSPEPVLDTIRAALARDHEVQAHDVVLLRWGSVPKTTSGKIRRRAARDLYLRDELQDVARRTVEDRAPQQGPSWDLSAWRQLDPEDRPAALETQLRHRVAAALREAPERVDSHNSLIALGLDSLGMVSLQHELEEQFGVTLPLDDALGEKNLRELASDVVRALEGDAAARLQGLVSIPGEGAADGTPTAGQQGLWLIQSMAPGSAAYQLRLSAWLRGEVDLDLLRQAFEGLVERHAALSTVFPSEGGRPLRRSAARGLEFHLDGAQAESREESLKRLRREAHRPMDLATGPLLRVAIGAGPAGERLLVIAVHHLVMDFWSAAVLLDELDHELWRLCGQDLAALPEPKHHFGELVAWRRKRLDDGRRKELWDYWKAALPHPLPQLALSTDRPRPPVLSDRGGAVRGYLGPGQARRLEALASACGTTLFAMLLTGWATVLHRMAGQDRVVVGTPTAGRPLAAMASIVGYLVEPVALSLDFSEPRRWSEMLQRVQRAVTGALAHAELPFGELAERLQPLRDPSRSPVFQNLFTWQRAPKAELAALGAFALGHAGARLPVGPMTLESLQEEDPPAQMDLALTAAQLGDGLGFTLVFSRDLFDASTAERLVDAWTTLLEAADTDAWLQRLPLLPESAQQQLRAHWRRRVHPLPASPLIHRLVAASAHSAPQRRAIGCRGEELSYGELEERANRLAAHLLELGCGAEGPVAVILGRGLDLPVALLAVLKAGGIYLPLDPTYPRERLLYQVQDSGARWLITDAAGAEAWPDFPGSVIDLEARRELLLEGAADPVAGPADPERLAYLIYTSGSTGRPKGVQVPHGAVANFLASMAKRPGLLPQDVLLSVTTPSFDIFVLELFLPLMVGAQVELAGDAEVASGSALLERAVECGATVMQATPSTWRMVLAAGWEGTPRLKVLCGGERLPPDLARDLLQRSASVWNLYGPTETTVWSAAHAVISGESAVPIGQAIDNTRLAVLDARWEPVPFGVPGQLYIGGAGVVRGYQHRPSLTAQRFIPAPALEPASDEAGGQRLYATGDLVTQDQDGTLHYLGRLDHQVKVRGHRIELGEIEAALLEHRAIGAAVVDARSSSQDSVELVAYLVPEEAAVEDPIFTMPGLREHLGERLPKAYVPTALEVLDALPLTPNGKVDRKALPDPRERRTRSLGLVEPVTLWEREVADLWREVLELDQISADENFFDLGGHSLMVSTLHARLEERLTRPIPLVELFRHTTVRTLGAYLASLETDTASGAAPSAEVASSAAAAAASPLEPMAVIGVGGRFPGAEGVEELWEGLRAGEELLTRFSDQQLLEAGVSEELLARPDYVKVSGVMPHADCFDAELFGYSPREAELMDPQHRVLLEVAWETFEAAGYDPRSVPGRVGVFGSVGAHTYIHQAAALEGAATAARYQIFIGNDKDFVPTRVAYQLGLEGPAVNVQTACSSSLVALHMARASLQRGECELALVAGITIRTPLTEGYLWEERGIPSPDGRCRAFDVKAAGTVFGSGAGSVLLKPLSRAQEDGDTVKALILSTAINNDGDRKIGFTAPSVDGQAAAISEAIQAAGIGSETIDYVEAHGTGTEIGDPIEVAALQQAFQQNARAERSRPCALGSVKTNLGHLDTAAGIVGVIKAVSCLDQRTLVPSLHWERPNPAIDFAAAGFRVQVDTAPWEANGHPRRAGVSSFGIGGTNAHAVLQEPPESAPTDPAEPWQPLLLSARSEEALQAARERLAVALARKQESPEDAVAGWGDVAFTLATGRHPWPYRGALVADRQQVALEMLEGQRSGWRRGNALGSEPPPVVFLFSGQGAQHPDMVADLYASYPVLRRELDRCCELLRGPLGFDLRELLLPHAERAPLPELEARLQDTAVAQPALFAVEWALAQQWRAWGVKPTAMIGHSLGEFVAATLAGVFRLEEALRLVAIRGRLMASMPPGDMLAVEMTEREARELLAAVGRDDLELAAINAPTSVVISGPAPAVDACFAVLEAGSAASSAGEGQALATPPRARRLHTSHAFHSAMMDPILESFRIQVEFCSLAPPRHPFVSSVTGTWIDEDAATDPEYWCRQLRDPVRFAEGVATLVKGAPGGGEEIPIVLEVGPGRSLATLARQQALGQTVLHSLPHPKDDVAAAQHWLDTCCRLWLDGVAVSWPGLWEGQRRRRVPLPTYPFERRRHWLQARPPGERAPQAAEAQELQRIADPARWGWAPRWRQGSPRSGVDESALESLGPWWLLAPRAGAGARVAKGIAQALSGLGEAPSVTVVTRGDDYRYEGGRAEINPLEPEHFERLLEASKSASGLPAKIVQLWDWDAAAEGAVEWPFQSLVALMRAVERVDPAHGAHLTLLTAGALAVTGAEELVPHQGMLLGAAPVLSQEYPQLSVDLVDLDAAEVHRSPSGGWAAALLRALASPPRRQPTALRGRDAWVRGFEPLVLPAESPSDLVGAPGLKPGGVYAITGGLGALGLEVADFLAQTLAPKLVLLSRRALAPRDAWADLAAGGEEPLLARLLGLVEAGAEIEVLQADVADRDSLRSALDLARQRFGPCHGVFHCAGVAGGGMAQLRTAEEVRRVLAPKVQGAMHLDHLLDRERLDFVVLFSSVNSVIGGFGQSDYAAANAFLDTFADSRRGDSARWVSVSWDRWERVGMAATSDSPLSLGAQSSGHPLLGRTSIAADGRRIYRSRLAPATHWELSEHRIAGHPTLPGTAYLEMVRAAVSEASGGGTATASETGSQQPVVELTDVVFLSPLALTDDAQRAVVVELREDASAAPSPAWSFRVASASPTAAALALEEVGEGWVEHARGGAAMVAPSSPEAIDLESLLAACPRRLGDEERDRRRSQASFLDTGLRWECLVALHMGEQQGVAQLELPQSVVSDVQRYGLHPALLDAAAGAVQFLSDGHFLPLGYQRLTVFGPLPQRAFGWLRLPGGIDANAETLSCDLTVIDEAGGVRVQVEGFSMRRVGAEMEEQLKRSAVGAEESDDALGDDGDGILPQEGVEVLRRILHSDVPSHLVVTTRALPALLQRADEMDREALSRAMRPAAATRRAVAASDYAEPEGDLQRTIAAVWQRVLGLDRVGAEDNFFELGGSSLSGIQLISELKQELGREIPTVAIFEAPTVAALARLLEPSAQAPSVTETAKDRAQKKRRALRRRKRAPPRR
ncbi:MAG: amino acid adenylation domain-containing protein [Acidobacteriota bacterium]